MGRRRIRKAVIAVAGVTFGLSVLAYPISWQWWVEYRTRSATRTHAIELVPGAIVLHRSAELTPNEKMVGTSFDRQTDPSLFGGLAHTFFVPRVARNDALTVIVIPFWIVSGTAGLIMLFAMSPWLIMPKSHCQSCGYNLRGLQPTICPECGKPVVSRSGQSATRPSETDSSPPT